MQTGLGLSHERCFRQPRLAGLSGREPVAEGYREGVQGGLPSHRPPCPAGPGRVKGPGHQIQALQGGLLGRKVPPGLDRPPVTGIKGLDRIRRADDLADLDVVVQERDELIPGVLPQPDDGAVALAPLLCQRALQHRQAA
jgi:hypothetical protein